MFLHVPIILFVFLILFARIIPELANVIWYTFPIKAKYFVAIYGAVELYLGLSNNPADNVAHFAHLGGMIFGFLLIKYWKKSSNTFY
jgi:membrane associated rhomboid family serine protease